MGVALKQHLKSRFTQSKKFKFEVFVDWLTSDDCYVSLDSKEKDKWDSPVARVKVGYHPHDMKVSLYIVNKGKQVMQAMGAQKVWGSHGVTQHLIWLQENYALEMIQRHQHLMLIAECMVQITYL